MELEDLGELKTAVFDTNIVSYHFKRDTRRYSYLDYFSEYEIWAISFATYSELKFWSLRYNWGTNRVDQLNGFIQKFKLINSSNQLCDYQAYITNYCMSVGKPIQSNDAWIAATAMLLDCPLITHNKKHFDYIENLKIITA